MRLLLIIILLSFAVQLNGYEEDYDSTSARNFTSIFGSYNPHQDNEQGDGFPQIISIGDYPNTETKVIVCDYFLEEYVCYTLNRY